MTHPGDDHGQGQGHGNGNGNDNSNGNGNASDRTGASASDEAQQVHARYARRGGSGRYSLLDPAALRERQGRQRALAQMLLRHGERDLSQLRLTEVGCGTGNNLLELLLMGFAPQHLQGIELLPERHAAARHVLTPQVQLLLGDAAQAGVVDQSQDLLLVATVFSSLLDDAFQARLAQAMWRWLKPGGAVIWYDFTVNNPRNADVRGVPLQRVQQLFPQASGIDARRITLAPPLARALCRVHPALCAPLEWLPPLRTHLLAWIAKPHRVSP